MQRLGNIRTFETANYCVSVDAYDNHDLDLSWDDDGTTRDGLESGKYIAFGVIARVYHKPTGIELGSDSLWGCIYESFDAFADHRECGKQNRELAKAGNPARCGSYFSGLISGAIAEAKANRLALRAA